MHRIRAVGVVDQSTGPSDDTRSVGWIATGPDPDLDLHWCLRILTRICGCCCQDSDCVTIDGPDYLFGCPINAVCVEAVVITWGCMEGAAVVCGCQALAKVIALYLSIITSQPFPIDLVKVIGEKDSGADNALTWCSLDDEINMAEHDVPLRCYCWGVAALCNCESCAV